ncbi:LacI family DNA-binding transcriptional regulator [Streptomyces sp. NPDC002403]
MVEEPGKRAGPGRAPAPAGRTARPRQVEVARLAGVSQATVSLVLADKRQGPAISEETRRRVLEAAGPAGGPGAVFRPADPERDLTPERLRSWLADGVTAFVAEETGTGAAWRALRRAVAEAGTDCPREASLALLGSPPADLADGPEPTGFDTPRTRLGAAAVRMLATLVAGEEATEPLVGCTFRPGATSGPPPADHRPTAPPVRAVQGDR